MLVEPGIVLSRRLPPGAHVPMAESLPPLTNRLSEEISPYLLQHQDNPVAWQTWRPETFATAKNQNKPILLSVGYAACHWCHVMAHESFENPEIAAHMNDLFVNIKVDREERPDIDTIYQQALALLGQHGGWPLTMFLTPDGEPFWGGTYFPPEARYGRPGLPDILERIAAVYRDDGEGVQKNVAALKEALGKLAQNTAAGPVPPETFDRIAAPLLSQIDPIEGGIGEAPKFPQVPTLKQLWRAWKRSRAEEYRIAVDLTLSKMCEGGIYDHLGGGFARYTVDGRWLVPHFEKMLYDNAQIIEVLIWAWQDSGSTLYARRVRETVDWIMREMIADADGSGTTPTGAFASALDADSEGEEGKFYVWSEAEIDTLLGAEAAAFKRVYDVSPGGNWEGKTILNRSGFNQSDAPALNEKAAADEERQMAPLRQILLAARARRPRPLWDDKVLADWNGLMIAALAPAASVFDAPAWLSAAEQAFAFVLEKMGDGARLRHAWRHGSARHDALLDDYANMAAAALALAEATGRSAYVARAEIWVDVLNQHFWDAAGGGYFQTPDDGETLIVRSKTAYDSAVPAGNGTMLDVLARLYYVTGSPDYRDKAEALSAAFSGELARNPLPLSTFLNGCEMLQRAVQIVVIGERGATDTQALLRAIFDTCLPNRVLQVIDPDTALPPGHPAAGKERHEERATAYVCR
ncbi:MAG: thioredoxin domain-containing protein, partial [Alphaproteobacteria bacterium]